MKFVMYFLLLVGALPLLIYPLLLPAFVMSLFGHKTGNEPMQLVLVVYSFLLGSLAYPGVFAVCAVLAVIQTRSNRNWMALGFAALPYLYLVLLAGLFNAWASMN